VRNEVDMSTRLQRNLLPSSIEFNHQHVDAEEVQLAQRLVRRSICLRHHQLGLGDLNLFGISHGSPKLDLGDALHHVSQVPDMYHYPKSQAHLEVRLQDPGSNISIPPTTSPSTCPTNLQSQQKSAIHGCVS